MTTYVDNNDNKVVKFTTSYFQWTEIGWVNNQLDCFVFEYKTETRTTGSRILETVL